MAVAVICEFNPFHNGHKYLLKTAKKLTGEPIIAVMSGSFTQRGEAALCNKFSRACTALQNGADLVLELPCAFAVSSAERFARAGTKISAAFGCTHSLAFGCETDDLALLKEAAESASNPSVQKLVKAEMNAGGYYPRALENAVRRVLGDKTANVLSTPNNVLAVEYIRALDKNITPLPIKRTGAEHNSQTPCGDIASAEHIRVLLRDGKCADKYLPEIPQNITNPKNLERIMLYRLRSMTTADFALLPEVSEGLENRICASVMRHNSVEKIIDGIKTKRYTHARIRRILTCALLGITEQLQNTPIDYVRVLGFTADGAALLKHCKTEVVTSAAQGLRLGGSIERLLGLDIYASDVAALLYDVPNAAGSDFTAPVVKI